VLLGDAGAPAEGGHLWCARFPSGDATVWLSGRADGVGYRAWGPGADEAVAALPALLGVHDSGAAGFDPGDERLRAVARRAPELRFGRTGQVWPALVRAVLGQRVTGLSALRSLRSLGARYSDAAPGPFPGVLLPIDPERLAQATSAELHAHNVERRRAELLIGLARRSRRLQDTARLPVAEATGRLRTLPGLGPWTLGLLAREVWGDPDAVAFGDYHLPHHVAFVLTGRPRSDDAELERLLAPWSGHRARALRLITRLPGPPRRGPRGDDPDLRGR
jgi:3-methyladenine DNA glycosylase/8-oxoguanine DNA glycosylase